MAVAALEEAGVEPRLNIGSTDANIPLSMGLPAIGLGITTGDGAHTQGEMINIQPIMRGLKQLTAVVKRLDGKN
jgi:di/tripeptidase